MESHFRRRPDDAGMQRAERAIRTAGWISLLALAAAVPLGYVALPAVIDFPQALAERLAFAARASLFVLLWVVAAVFMVSSGRRTSPADIGGSAGGPPSDRIAVRVAFLHNTLEQAVIATALYFALATLLSGAWLSLIVVGVAFFAIGRILFLRGYARGAEGRSLGMTLTMLPTVCGYVLAVVLMVMRWW
jgi:hypothetical protein